MNCHKPIGQSNLTARKQTNRDQVSFALIHNQIGPHACECAIFNREGVAWPFDVQLAPYISLGGGLFGTEMQIITPAGGGNGGNFTIGHGMTPGDSYEVRWTVTILGTTTPNNPSADYRCEMTVQGTGIDWTFARDAFFSLGTNTCFRGEKTIINGSLNASNLVVTNFTDVAA